MTCALLCDAFERTAYILLFDQATGGLGDALSFARAHPPLLGDAMTLSVSQAPARPPQQSGFRAEFLEVFGYVSV